MPLSVVNSFLLVLVTGFRLSAHFLLLECFGIFFVARTPIQLPVDFLQSKPLFSEANSAVGTFLRSITIVLQENQQVSVNIINFCAFLNSVDSLYLQVGCK